MNLVRLLVERAAEAPERPALVETRNGRDQAVTYGELAARVAGGAAALRAMGLRRGDTLWLMQPVSITLYELMLAAFHAGMRVMLADPRGGRNFLTECCRRAQPAAWCGPWRSHLLRWPVPALRAIRVAVRTSGWLPATTQWRTSAGSAPPEAMADDEAALVTFTSGSTGAPKAAVRTHGLLMAQHRALTDSLAFAAGEVDLITLPVFVLANLASGLTSVLAATDLSRPGAPDAAAVAAQSRRWRVTRCTASPAFFEGLMAADGGLPEFGKVFTGGGPVWPDFLRRMAGRLPRAEIHAIYGSTEAEPIAHAALDLADGRDGMTRAGAGLCAGTPTGGTELRVIRAAWGQSLGPLEASQFATLVVPPGGIGEIVVAGPHVVPGYLGGMGDEETKIRVNGRVFHRTGDAGWLDATGRLWLLGRCAEKLPPPTGNLQLPAGIPPDAARYPFAVECALREEFPLLRTAAVEWQGKRLLAVAGIAGEAASNALHAAAARWGMDEVACLPALPLDKRHQAKLDYPALRATLAARR
jgi:acyl-CoA synthetase (AMP-forming)/AMP-acid ligase II